MILNLLQQEGIVCRIDGEYLQGGAGELQAMNMVRVMVDEADYTKAQNIINEWESREIEKTEAPATEKKSPGIGTGLFFGLCIGAGITAWTYNSPIDIEGIDYNNDGVLDERWTYRDNRMSKIEMDRNLDGEIDLIHDYDYRGRIAWTKLDDNFDGQYESTVTYKRNNADLIESDLNGDGKIDLRTFFTNDAFHKVEIIDPVTNMVRKKQTYKLGKLISSEFDSNGDGIFDQLRTYDYYEEVKQDQ